MKTETIPDEVPLDIEEGLMEIRKTGRINMFDRLGVIDVAVELGLDETASWMRDKRNREAYVAWFFGDGATQ